MITRQIPRKLTELGRIRLGAREPNAKGNGSHPHKLSQFRLTSSNKPLLEYAARHPGIGGEVREWDDAPGEGRQWELYTTTDTLDVVIPTFSAISLNYEIWAQSGCTRRCTGETIVHCPLNEALVLTSCVCPDDDQERARLAQSGKACARILRLNVILPDLPGTGFWRMDTKGFYATAELMGTLELLKEAGAEHVMIEAALRLEQRTTKKPGTGDGHGTLQYAVPVLWPKYTFRQIAAAREQKFLMAEATVRQEQKSLAAHIEDLTGQPVEHRPPPTQPAPDQARREELIVAVTEQHMAHNCDAIWISRYWAKMCKWFRVQSSAQLTVAQLEGLLAEVEAYYAKVDQPQTSHPLPKGEAPPEAQPQLALPITDTPSPIEGDGSQAWRTMLADVLPALKDATLKREAESLLEDADVSAEDGNAMVSRVLYALETQDDLAAAQAPC